MKFWFVALIICPMNLWQPGRKIKCAIYVISGDIYDEWQPRIAGLGVETECVGGGRILHEADKKTIKVFGYSQVSGSRQYFPRDPQILTFSHIFP